MVNVHRDSVPIDVYNAGEGGVGVGRQQHTKTCTAHMYAHACKQKPLLLGCASQSGHANNRATMATKLDTSHGRREPKGHAK